MTLYFFAKYFHYLKFDELKFNELTEINKNFHWKIND